MSSYQVDPQALKLAADGIDHAIEELRSLGIEEAALVGRGFGDISLTGLEIGHPQLQSVFEEFCDRWSWGVRALIQDGNEIARRLNLSAGLYAEQEEYVTGVAKELTNAALGNPNLTGEDLEKMSYREVLADNPFTQVRDADFSAESLAQSSLRSQAAVQATKADLLENPFLRGHAAAAGFGGELAEETAESKQRAEQLTRQAEQFGDRR
ncbi:hypothetical protein ACIA8O_06280 [Kitasatospora sp. NPDC051853]|uniref:hypothetical protein n=1 Tax=Kitasatospora sp. NPDC051853 TaxID=3364058 RepID=UPI0037897614